MRSTINGTVLPGFRALGFSELPGFRALKADNRAWSVHKTLFGFKAGFFLVAGVYKYSSPWI